MSRSAHGWPNQGDAMKRFLLCAVTAVAALVGSSAYAGPFILAGTDADDHGFANAAGNQDGWFFMQRALENLAPGVSNGNKKVTILGSTSTSLQSANSAFGLSTLVGLGWTVEVVSTANFATFFGNADPDLDTGILMMDSGINITGGVSGTLFDSYADEIDDFLGDGGALFSQANGYSWLSSLIPGISAPGESNTGLALTADGAAAFPGLNNGDLSAGPYHNRFNNFGALKVLATSTATNNAIIIGGAGGSISDPCAVTTCVPEPGSPLLVLAALGAAGLALRKRHAG